MVTADREAFEAGGSIGLKINNDYTVQSGYTKGKIESTYNSVTYSPLSPSAINALNDQYPLTYSSDYAILYNKKGDVYRHKSSNVLVKIVEKNGESYIIDKQGKEHK